MPIIKSAIKRAKQSITRRSRNLQVKRAVKQDTQAVLAAIAAGDVKVLDAKLAEAYSEIDRAVKKHTLHKNTAARRKAQLAAAVSKVSAPGAEVEAKPKAATSKGAGKAASAKKTATAKKPAAKKTPAKKAPATKE